MAKIWVGEQLVDVNIRKELQQFDWNSATFSEDKMIAASPFRWDRKPSFYCYFRDTHTMKAGFWGDSGADDSAHSYGNLVSLLSFLMNAPEIDVIEYLLDKYGNGITIEEIDTEFTLDLPELDLRPKRIVFPEKALEPYRFTNPYLTNRGISESVQRYIGVGYCNKSKAIVIPWRHPNGDLGNFKFRKVNSKQFWYVKDGNSIKDMIFGLDIAFKRNLDTAILCEAEVDAMSFMSAGFYAIAVGNSAFPKKKKDLLLSSPIKKIIIAADNDKAGRKLRNKVVDEMNLLMKIEEICYPTGFKDANEVYVKKGEDFLKNLVLNSKTLGIPNPLKQ